MGEMRIVTGVYIFLFEPHQKKKKYGKKKFGKKYWSKGKEKKE